MAGIIPLPVYSDARDGGLYRIHGTVSELGVNGRYQVALFERARNRCIRSMWSDSNGAYVFNYLRYRLNGYFVIAFDHGENPLNAAIADLVTPEPMP